MTEEEKEKMADEIVYAIRNKEGLYATYGRSEFKKDLRFARLYKSKETALRHFVDNEYYIDTQTGIATKKNETVLLGKVVENIIDLIEVGDIVNKSEVYETGQSKNGQKWIHTWRGFLYYEEDLEKATILTHEQYEQNCYTVERK